ncbi:MAG: hypothetical protein HQ580_06475 [Planctomycetes bacterium]|nr:hypothetical protein [Planctomycetota bacterium]
MKQYTKLTSLITILLIWAALVLAHPLRADEPFDYFHNSWTVIGLKDYAHGTRITPDNQLVIHDSNKKPSRVLIRFGRQLTPLTPQQTKKLMNGWLPVVLITAEDGQVKYEFTLWATPLPSVKDWQKAFGWPIESENFLNWVLVKVTNTGPTIAKAKLKVERNELSDSRDHTFAWSLAAGESADAVISIPFSPLKGKSDFTREDAKLWLGRTVQYWQGVMAKAAQIRVPCEKATEALLASHMYQLISNDHGEVHPGEGFYDEFYIRDGAYQIMEFEEAGMIDAAQKAMQSFLTHQRPDGRFESQKNQFDANGQACWALWQFYKITGDQQWLKKVYPQMRRAADWMLEAKRQVPADSPFSGVLPNAPADGEYLWGGKHHIVGYDFWNLRALLCTADAAQVLGKADEAKELLGQADLYRNAINKVSKQTGLDYFPPSWEKAGTHWGNTETLWPTELFAPHDPRVTALIKQVRQKHGGGFIEGTIQWLGHPDAIHPYMSSYTTLASLIRGEHEQVVEDFYWYLLHSTAAHAFPEGIYYKKRIAWNDTIPHTLGASNYAILLRHMLIHERPDELHLLKAIPDWWLAEGKEIRIERAPTHFGPMNLIVTGTNKGVRVKFDPPRRQPPKRIFLYLPKSRKLIKPLKDAEVIHRSNQKTHWDFPKVVRLYSQKGKNVHSRNREAIESGQLSEQQVLDVANKEAANSAEQAILKFALKLDPDIYTKSNYKKPPQFAIWLEEAAKGTIRTVWVTSKTGTGGWGSNVIRTVSLPYWVSRWNIETQSRSYPTQENQAINAVTGATPKIDFTAEALVPAKSLWNYFIEVNVSGDYNDAFPVTQKDGKRDRQGNGQPSIIYRGKITSSPGRRSSPQLIGRTEQFQSVKYIITDLEGITTTQDLFSTIEVSCQLP